MARLRTPLILGGIGILYLVSPQVRKTVNPIIQKGISVIAKAGKITAKSAADGYQNAAEMVTEKLDLGSSEDVSKESLREVKANIRKLSDRVANLETKVHLAQGTYNTDEERYRYYLE